MSDGSLLTDGKMQIRECINPREPEIVAIELGGEVDPSKTFCGRCKRRSRNAIVSVGGHRANRFLCLLEDWYEYIICTVQAVYNDPWIIVRPPDPGQPRTRMNLDAWQVNRARRRGGFAPGQNRNGEDFTDLFILGAGR